jgi:hypothetical protein
MKTWQNIIAEQVEGKADLQALYNDLNKSLFANMLPKIPIKWTTAKRVAGEVQVSYELDADAPRHKALPLMGKVSNWKFLGISKKFNLDDENLKGIMAHEMLHVDLLHQGIIKTSGRDGMHGPEFTDRLKIIRARANFPIPATETNLAPSEKNVARPTGYVWLKQAGKNFIVKASPKFIEKNLAKLIGHFAMFFLGLNKTTDLVEIGIANTGGLETTKGIRKVPWKGWSTMTDEQIQKTLINKDVLHRKIRV